MSVEIQDYQNALDTFLHKLNSQDDCVKSLLLFGSMARGTVRPGKSDIDLFVVLYKEVTADYQRFSGCFDTLIEVSEYLANCGVPYHHPAFIYFEDELSFLHESYHGIFSDDAVKILLGEDIRSQIGGHVNPEFDKAALIEVWRQFCLPLAKHLGKNDLSQEELSHLKEFFFKMSIGVIARAVEIITSTPLEQVSEKALQQVMPDRDWAVIGQILNLKVSQSTMTVPEYLLLLKQVLSLTEVLISELLLTPNS